eukprot:TRINITY_DN102171_c0_g1_i1.p1 TRINITY_DN102171_c0_g1~~TRINITY_DN102171_c0_g1_i1.p1  ORF type:complete len:534 (+),score=142.72 TRINITY_DN102171_c0_g1_i1:68-1603(+)
MAAVRVEKHEQGIVAHGGVLPDHCYRSEPLLGKQRRASTAAAAGWPLNPHAKAPHSQMAARVADWPLSRAEKMHRVIYLYDLELNGVIRQVDQEQDAIAALEERCEDQRREIVLQDTQLWLQAEEMKALSAATKHQEAHLTDQRRLVVELQTQVTQQASELEMQASEIEGQQTELRGLYGHLMEDSSQKAALEVRLEATTYELETMQATHAEQQAELQSTRQSSKEMKTELESSFQAMENLGGELERAQDLLLQQEAQLEEQSCHIQRAHQKAVKQADKLKERGQVLAALQKKMVKQASELANKTRCLKLQEDHAEIVVAHAAEIQAQLPKLGQARFALEEQQRQLEEQQRSLQTQEDRLEELRKKLEEEKRDTSPCQLQPEAMPTRRVVAVASSRSVQAAGPCGKREARAQDGNRREPLPPRGLRYFASPLQPWMPKVATPPVKAVKPLAVTPPPFVLLEKPGFQQQLPKSFSHIVLQPSGGCRARSEERRQAGMHRSPSFHLTGAVDAC